MNFNLYVDPGELKKSSKFVKCRGINDFSPISLPGLEEMTGADNMISPLGLPLPKNKFLLKMHLDEGALLIQLKFSFDLIASIIDGRFKHSQAKMLATGATAQQVILLFIGFFHEEENRNLPQPTLMVNGQKPEYIIPAAKNLSYKSVLKQRLLWAKRGGIFDQIDSAKHLAAWIETAAEIAFNEPLNRQVWEPKQELFLIKDWRNLIVNLPGLGEKRAQAIYERLEDKSFYGFLDALKDESLKDVPGIGLGTIEKIQKYLKGI